MDHQAINHILEERIGVTIQDARLLEQALTHDSCGEVGRPFERLEFLGDACLEMVVADLLYTKTALSEGQMSPFRNSLTRKESLAEILRSWKIEKHLRMGDSMDLGNLPDTVYADVLESLLGAVYRDGGFESLQVAVTKLFAGRIEEQKHQSTFANPKTRLQEWAMARKLPLPKYTILSSKGPSHQPEYHLEVRVNDRTFEARARSIRVAESEAALQALKSLEEP